MPVRLDTSNAGFAEEFETLLGSKREASEEVGASRRCHPRRCPAQWRRGGARLHRPFRSIAADRLDASPSPAPRSTRPRPKSSGDVRAALQLAHDRIFAHHEKQKPLDHIYQDHLGVTLGTVWTPVEAVGIYVPGGTASYPSSVLMNAVPAKVAGVTRIAMVVPTPARRNQSRRARRRQDRRRHRNLPHRRRPGHRRAGLRHRDHQAGRARSSARAMPMWPPPSARSSAPSAST